MDEENASITSMSIFGDDGVDDLLNGNDLDNNEQLFGDDEAQENNENDGETPASSGTAVKVQPKKRNVLNPRPRLTEETLRGPRGLHTIEEYFSDIKFKGKGYEKQDLDEIMRRLQHWGHRMYPTYKFDDVLANIERLGKKKTLQVHMSRYRLGMLEATKTHGNMNEADGDGDELAAEAGADEPFDEFDALLDEQIAISKIAPRTPAPSSSKYAAHNANNTGMSTSSSFSTPSFSRGNAVMSTPYSGIHNLNDTSDLATPLPQSQPSTPATKQLTAEQMARIAENRRLAQERLAAKKLAAQKTQELNGND
ncbi:protein TIPIN homolog [Musca vetustissima]|uniref:protein TIPIN homolog n=1 Tax=Musca vetustissima TaxID=27455 RepID=UPI002AB76A2C|nr:protein TIPIN homolog [Musca vetustissima]